MSQKDLSELIEFARKLHGHVGPYLVLGLKMGLAVKNALGINGQETAHQKLQSTCRYIHLLLVCLTVSKSPQHVQLAIKGFNSAIQKVFTHSLQATKTQKQRK